MCGAGRVGVGAAPVSIRGGPSSIVQSGGRRVGAGAAARTLRGVSERIHMDKSGIVPVRAQDKIIDQFMSG
jgi:hypothetical protein